MQTKTQPVAARPLPDYANEVRDALLDIQRTINEEVPENQRHKTVNALNAILNNGWLFAVACAKAGIIRGRFYGDPTQLWPFIDERNAEFEAAMRNLPRRDIGLDMLARWNAPDYELTQTGGGQ